MAGAFLPEVHRVGEGRLSRSDILRGNLGMIAGTRRAILCRRSVRPVVTHPTTRGLSLGLHGGCARKPRIKHEGTEAILGAEGVDRCQSFSGSSACTGRAAYSGDTNVKEQPLKGLHRHGKALAGVASSISMVVTMLRRIIPVARCR